MYTYIHICITYNLCLVCLNLIMFLMYFIPPKTKNMDNGEKTEIS